MLGCLAQKCVRLRETCYWAGASAIALEELHHWQSFDLGFHTRKALVDVRPILVEIQRVFPGRFEVVSGPDEFGSGFKGVLRLPGLEAVTIEVLSNSEDVPPRSLVPSTRSSGASACSAFWRTRSSVSPRGQKPATWSTLRCFCVASRGLKRTLTFARRIGTVRFEASPGREVDIPLFPGILKHAVPAELAELLSSAAAVRKYTCEALRTAAWPILREFPQEWLKACMPLVEVRPGRRRALEFLLDSPSSSSPA